nr:prepilin-type N-terminal cleavage/methylation domain-containing protein [uncultured Cellulosilyticum sp.]
MKQKGFSLLEMVLSIMLSAVLLQVMIVTVSNIYEGVVRFRTKVNYSEQIRIVSDFIRDEIRGATKVSIKVQDGSSVKVIENGAEDSDLEIKGMLDEIKYVTAENTVGEIRLRKNSIYNLKQGKYSLFYEGKESDTQNLIGDLVDELKVVRMADSNYITFTCVIGGVNQTMGEQMSFTESLAYKEKID